MAGNYRSGNLQQGAPLGENYKTVLLSADNQVVNPMSPDAISRINLQSDSTTAANRTFTLIPSPIRGHRLTLYFESGSSMTCQLANSGTAKLESAWEPLQFNQIELESDGTYWIESSRGASPGLDVITLASAKILVGSSGGVAAAVDMSGDATIANTGAVTIANNAITTVKITDANVTLAKLENLTSGRVIVGSVANVPTAVVMSGDATIIASGALTIANNAITTVKITDANVTLAKLAAGITPASVTKYSGKLTTVGGNATEAFTVSGVLSTDRLLVTMQTQGTGSRTILSAAPTTDTITIVFSGDPSNNHIIAYTVDRTAA